jgi:ribonuclease Z
LRAKLKNRKLKKAQKANLIISMANLIFLGTGAATPSKHRSLPAVVLRLNNGELFLFDAGEDVQRKFEAAKLKFNTPTTIFISHMHGDHVIGLPGLLFNFRMCDRSTPLTIYGPEGLAGFLHSLQKFVGLHATNYDLTLFEICIPPDYEENSENLSSEEFKLKKYEGMLSEDEKEPITIISKNIIHENKECKVKTFWMNHRIPTLGFRVEENPYKGKFNPKRAIELQIPKGILWNQMHKGETVETPNGETIDPVEMGIVTPERPGHVYSYSGDTTVCPNVYELAKNADFFVCEATFSFQDEKLAVERHHLSSKLAAKIAKDSEVKKLFLTHISSRYRDTDELLSDALEVFPNTIIAEDLMDIEIKPPIYERE